MAVDMFIKIGDIKGESQDSKHKGEVDILAWSWGMSNSGTTHTGGGGGSGKVSVQDISFTKYVDSASHTLMLHCCNGKHIDKAQLVVRKGGGDKPLEYIKLDIEDIVVSSVSSGGSGGQDRLTENVSLNFARFKYAYTPQKADGSGDAAKEAGWDIAKNLKI